MTLDEACLYLAISPDDEDLDIDEIEKNYRTKLSIYNPSRFNPDSPEYREARRMREKINAAYDYLLEAYNELYGEDYDDEDYGYNNKFTVFVSIAAAVAAIMAACFAGFIFFYDTNMPVNMPSKIDITPVEAPTHNEDYEKLLREVERLRIIAEAPREVSAPAPTITTTPNNSGITDYADLVERVMPSIVLIETNSARGSGFFVSNNGDILTNYHVIRGAHSIRVTTQTGSPVNALVKDYDPDKDIALLAISSTKSTPALKISTTLPRQGEAVIAIGNPKGLQGTVSNGIVSAFRDNNTWVQFTAPISPGSSGGALINLKGEVVGMPTMLLTEGQNLNFAIAPTVLGKFFTAAGRKPAKNLYGHTQPDTTRGISLPNSQGFLVHKWGCSLESVRRYVSSPLRPVGNNQNYYSTYKTFKAFNAKIDTFVVYEFTRGKLNAVILIPDTTSRSTNTIDRLITSELTKNYGFGSDDYHERGIIERTWDMHGMTVTLLNNRNQNFLGVQFSPHY